MAIIHERSPEAVLRYCFGPMRGAADASPCRIRHWFHVTMRITVLRQHAKGLAGCRHDHEEAEEVDNALRRIKGFL